MDKRYLRAEEMIRNTFFNMLKEMPVYKLTVSELCRRTNINRGTFYLHYQDCIELVEVLSNEIVDLFMPFIDDICTDRLKLQGSIIGILKTLTENENVALLIQSSELCRQIINRRFHNIVCDNWKRLSDICDSEANMMYSYISGGVFEAIKNIKADGISVDTNEQYKRLSKLINFGLSGYVKEV